MVYICIQCDFNILIFRLSVSTCLPGFLYLVSAFFSDHHFESIHILIYFWRHFDYNPSNDIVKRIPGEANARQTLFPDLKNQPLNWYKTGFKYAADVPWHILFNHNSVCKSISLPQNSTPVLKKKYIRFSIALFFSSALIWRKKRLLRMPEIYLRHRVFANKLWIELCYSAL